VLEVVSEDRRCCGSEESRPGLAVGREVSFVATDVELKCGDASRGNNRGRGFVASARKRFVVRTRSRSRAWRNLGLSGEASIVDRLK
jgi:hypothetical protein